MNKVVVWTPSLETSQRWYALVTPKWVLLLRPNHGWEVATHPEVIKAWTSTKENSDFGGDTLLLEWES